MGTARRMPTVLSKGYIRKPLYEKKHSNSREKSQYRITYVYMSYSRKIRANQNRMD